MSNWFYRAGDTSEGPFDDEEFLRLLSKGKVTEETFVWTEEIVTWQKAAGLEAFQDKFKQSPSRLASPHTKPVDLGWEQTAALEGGLPGSAELQTRSTTPWPRFWARFIDNLLFSPALSFLVLFWAARHAPKIYIQIFAMNTAIYSMFVFPVVGFF